MRPDFALLDIEMPGVDGVNVAKKALQMSPNTKNIICSGHADRYSFAELAQSGIQAFLLKPFSTEKLVVALQAALKGEVWCDPLMVNRAYQKSVDEYRESEATRIRLTPLETSLLKIVKTGKRHSEIALELSMNKNTLKSNLYRLCQKLGCESMTELRVKAHKFLEF